MLEPQDPTEVLRRSRDLLLLTIFAIVALLFSGRHTTTAFSKTTSFYILVWLALILEFVLTYRNGRPDLRSWRPTLACLGGFLLWCTISAIWVAPIPRSFRELSRWLALISLVVVSIGAGRSAWFRRQILWFGTLIPLIVALYACVQYLGYDFFIWPEFEWEEEFPRVTSTLGNPDFLAGFLLGTIPLSVVYGFANTKRWKKVFSGVSVVFQFTAVILTLSRGVWIGLICSAAALLVIIPNRRETIGKLLNLRMRPKIAVAILAVLLAGVVLFWPAVSNLYLRAVGGSPISLSGRRHIYVSSLRLAAKHPIFGVGLDAFPVRFPEVRTPELSQFLPFNKWYVEHAHSEPLEVLVDLGIVGFLLWLGIFYFWGRTVLTRLRQLERPQYLLVGAAWVAVIGILGHNLVTVTLRHSSTCVPFWAFFGIAMGASQVRGDVQTVRKPNWWRWIVLALLVAGGPLVWRHGTREHQADRYLREAHEIIAVALNEELHYRKVKPCHDVLDMLARADRLAPVRKESLYWRAWAYYELRDYEASHAEYKRTIELEGPFVHSVPNLGKVLLNLGLDYMNYGFQDHGRRAYRESVTWWERACEMEPENAQNWRNLAGALAVLGRIDGARDAFNRALELETDPARIQRIHHLMQQLEKDAAALQKQAESFIDDKGLDESRPHDREGEAPAEPIIENTP